MGIKNMFKKKEPTEEELREHLNNSGIATKSNVGGREEKFGAFKQYAQQKSQQRPGFAPVNPYANVQNGAPGSNPYAQNGGAQAPDGQQDQNQSQGQTPGPYGQLSAGNPYGQQSQQASPYGQQNTQGNPNPYGQARKPPGSQSNPYGSQQSARSNPYGQTSGTRTNGNVGGGSSEPDPYSSQTNRAYDRGPSRRNFDEESLDLNAIPSNIPGAKKPLQKYSLGFDDEDDLNALPEEDDLNIDILPEEQEVNSEDEEIEAIRQDIRFVKQESVSLTRNTLRMAQEADALATNTLGMLGSQSERLYNAEQNLLLADTQTKIAEEKVEQLRRLNRSIFIPATSVNPFNKKSKLRQRELKLKTEKAQEKYLRDNNRKGVYESEQRIKEGLVSNTLNSATHQKYKGEQSIEAAKRYQFENDSEDDEMEKEMASNLDQIGLFAKKLKNSANTMGQEVDSQNERLRKIEDDADRLDISVHLNNTRLSNIR